VTAAPDADVIASANHGALSVEVWPVYVGLAESTSETIIREPIFDLAYDRGQITWQTHPDGSIIGRGRVYAPKGVYTHIVFAVAPVEGVIGTTPREHPIVFDRPGWVDIDPIHNQTYLPRGG
jgi:hypothetical protein